MTGGRSIALGIAAGLLVLSIVVAIVLIPLLDEQLRRATARRHANDNRPAGAPDLPREVHHG